MSASVNHVKRVNRNIRLTTLCLIAALFALVLLPQQAAADGVQFNVTCNSIAWSPNLEPDLAGYHLYDRVSLSNTPTLIKTYGVQVTSATCLSLGLNTGQHYLSMRAFDSSGNEGQPSTEIPFIIIADSAITNLTITAITTTSMTIQFKEVDGGTGLPASYDVRADTPLIDWGTAPSVASGTCSTPLAGVTIGALLSCTITGLSTTTPYQIQIVPFRGTLGMTPVYSPFSNIVSGITGGAVPSPLRITKFTDAFTRANGALVTPWMAGFTSWQTPTINGDAVRPPSAGMASMAIYNAPLANDQWAQISIPTIQGAGTVSAFIKLRHHDTPTASGYECRANRNNASVRSEIAKRVNGSSTTLISENSTTWASGDELDCEIQGTTLILSRISGGVTTQILTIDDSTFVSGKAGVALVSSVLGDGVIDNFSEGEFQPAVPVEDPCGCDQH